MSATSITLPRYDYIDALRGIAILLVLLVHTSQFGSNVGNHLFPLAIQGARGVQLFYIISAFTLFLSFSKRCLVEKRPTLNFLIRRFFRIAPLFYIAIAYYLFQDGFGPRYWLGDAPAITAGNIFTTFTFINGFNPYWITSIVPGGWSIAIEMLFYILLPFLYHSITNLKKAWGWLLGALVGSYALTLFLSYHPLIHDARLWTDYLSLYFPTQFPIFLLGILLFFVLKEKNSEEAALARPVGRRYAVLLLATIALWTAHLTFGKIISLMFLFSLGFVGLAYLLHHHPMKFFVNKFTRFIGMISFGMYLIHFAVLHYLTQFHFVDFTRQPELNFLVRYLLVVAITAFVATITYYIIEKPGQRLGAFIINRLEKAA